MKPNKLETQIKEQLNAREIQPSEMAWDRLDAMLSVAEEKKTRRFGFLSFRSIGIAASVLVLISLGLFFFNQKEIVVQPENNVVTKEKINSDSSTNLNTNQQNQQVAEVNAEPLKNNHQKSSSSFIQNNQKTKNQSLINQEKEVQIQKQEAVAQKELVSNPSPLKDYDLLASVEKTPKSSAKVKVNANSLLSQVDGELDQSFREKVLTKISKNYQEVKVALATRNQE